MFPVCFSLYSELTPPLYWICLLLFKQNPPKYWFTNTEFRPKIFFLLTRVITKFINWSLPKSEDDFFNFRIPLKWKDGSGSKFNKTRVRNPDATYNAPPVGGGTRRGTCRWTWCWRRWWSPSRGGTVHSFDSPGPRGSEKPGEEKMKCWWNFIKRFEASKLLVS